MPYYGLRLATRKYVEDSGGGTMEPQQGGGYAATYHGSTGGASPTTG